MNGDIWCLPLSPLSFRFWLLASVTAFFSAGRLVLVLQSLGNETRVSHIKAHKSHNVKWIQGRQSSTYMTSSNVKHQRPFLIPAMVTFSPHGGIHWMFGTGQIVTISGQPVANCDEQILWLYIILCSNAWSQGTKTTHSSHFIICCQVREFPEK